MRHTRRMAALSRFIAKSAEKSLPFFKVLRGNKNFFWEDKQKKAYQELENHLHSLPTLARPVTRETLYLYVAASQTTVSAAIVREERNMQQPIYFVSKILLDAKTRYSLIEKKAYAVVGGRQKTQSLLRCPSGNCIN